MSKGSRRRPEARPGAYAEAYERIFGQQRALTREQKWDRAFTREAIGREMQDDDTDSEADA